MAFLDWLRRIFESPSSPHAVADHDWGEVREWVEGGCRNVQWSANSDSWISLEPVVDRFLAACVDAVVAAYRGEPVGWLVLEFNPLTGMLSARPTREPAPAVEGGRVELSLSSLFWEAEAVRTYNESDDGSYDSLYGRVWRGVRASLERGEASRRLAAARATHPLRVTGFNCPTGCDDEPVGELTESGSEGR